MLCQKCKITAPANTAAGGKCTTKSCSNLVSSRHYLLCISCSKSSGKCEACIQMVVNSGAGKPGTVRPLGGK